MTNTTVSRTLVNPFPGLRPFRADEQDLFFGREAQVDRMVDKLAATRFLAVVGTSGSGKSSLVNCGLRPALHRGLMPAAGTSWWMVQFRPGGDPIREMAAALSSQGAVFARPSAGLALEEMVEATLRMSSMGLVDIFRQAGVSSALLVVVDQFEELFRYRKLRSDAATDGYGPGQEATAFVRLLLEAQEQQQYPIYVALTMRSDFLGDCSKFDGLPEAINESQYLVPRLTREERRSAIAGPVAVAGATMSPALLTRLTNDVGDNPDQLSILQHALNRTWHRWENEGRAEAPLSLDHYEGIGGMAHALDLHAERAFGELRSERQRAICERIFKALTDQGTDARGIRRPTKLGTLCDIVGATVAEVVAVIDVFRKPSRSFLMPPLPEEPRSETPIDISHETLMRVWVRLRKWADEETRAAREYRGLVDRATRYPDRAGLMPDPDLQTTLDWESRQKPTGPWAALYGGGLDAALAYLRKSEMARDHGLARAEIERRWRSSWQPLIVAFVAILFLLSVKYLHDSRYLQDSLDDIMFPPSSSSDTPLDRIGKILLPLVKVVIAAIPCAGLYWLLSWQCRKILLRFGFPKALKAVQAAARAMRKPTRERDPATKFGTTYAAWWRRVVATVIDGVIDCGLLVASAGIAMWLDSTNDPEPRTLWGCFFLAHWLYQTLMIRSRWQATLGMRIARVFVTDSSGRRLSLLACTGRMVAKLALCGSMAIWGPILFLLRRLAPQWLFVKRWQQPHDIFSRAVVLVRPAKQRVAMAALEGVAAAPHTQGAV